MKMWPNVSRGGVTWIVNRILLEESQAGLRSGVEADDVMKVLLAGVSNVTDTHDTHGTILGTIFTL